MARLSRSKGEGMTQNAPTYQPYLRLFRCHTEALFAALMKHTGMTKSGVGLIVGGQRQYLTEMLKRDGFRVSSHDRALENFSAIWPPDLPWPDGVPRPDPAIAMSRVEGAIEHATVTVVRDKAAGIRLKASDES